VITAQSCAQPAQSRAQVAQSCAQAAQSCAQRSTKPCNFQKTFCLLSLAAPCQKTGNFVSLKNVSDIRIVSGWSEIKAFI
jgi:hypothetical protein